MAVWSAVTDLKPPMQDDLRVHFMARRGELLAHFSNVADSWLLILDKCSAQGMAQADLQALCSEIAAFKTRADEGMNELRGLGVQESLSDDFPQMLEDPDIASTLTRFLRPKGAKLG